MYIVEKKKKKKNAGEKNKKTKKGQRAPHGKMEQTY